MSRIVAFLVLFVVLLGAYEAGRGSALERFVVEDLTVRTASWIIAVLDPSIGVRADGSRLTAHGGGIVILKGCEGVDVMLLLAAAMAVAALPWQARLAGLAAGVALTFAMNQARIVALFYAFRLDRELFASLHGFVTPVAMTILAGAFFVAWHARFARSTRARP